MLIGDEQTWAQRWDAAAAQFLHTDVSACAQGTRTRGWSSMALGQLSGAAGLVQHMRAKKKAGGLPQMFLVAVTRDRLHVLAMPKLNWKVTEPRATKELASWDLDAIRVSSEPVFNAIKLIIEAPAAGERVEIQVPEGFTGERVVQALGARQAVAA